MTRWLDLLPKGIKETTVNELLGETECPDCEQGVLRNGNYCERCNATGYVKAPVRTEALRDVKEK